MSDPVGSEIAVGELISRLIDDAKRFARAEVDYYKQLGLAYVGGLKLGVILVVVAIFLLQASLTTLLIGIGLLLAHFIAALGVDGGVIVAAVIGLAICGLLVRIAVGRFAKVASGEAIKDAAP